MIRKATELDIDRLFVIYEDAKKFMASIGNPNQWKSHGPSKRDLLEEVKFSRLYIIQDVEGEIEGAFSMMDKNDSVYENVCGPGWKLTHPENIVVIHKLVSSRKRKGIAKEVFEYARMKANGIRIDTHHDNAPMQHLLRKERFSWVGTITLKDGSLRDAFEYFNDKV